MADKKNPVREVLDSAESVGPADAAEDIFAGVDGIDWDTVQHGAPWYLPDDCPVTALGLILDVYYYLDAARQLRAIKAKDHSRLNVLALFGRRQAYLYAVWPRLQQDSKTKTWYASGWRPEAAIEALMDAAARKGPWDIMGKVRGPGGWVEDDGRLVFHCGDVLWLGGNDTRPAGTMISDDYVYPTAVAGARPAENPQPGGEDGPAWKLLELLNSWAWKRGEIDALLLLGWIGAAMLGGALDWRPVAWITGGRGTGKSTVHKILKSVIESMLSSSNATAASIWQVLGHASLPVAIDELEARDDNRRAQAVIELAREAASGGVLYRGGNDHTGVQFTTRSSFLFSSILIPPLAAQDISRMAILELEKLGSITPPDLVNDRAGLRALGRGLRRRLVDGWPQFHDRLDMWRRQLEVVGHEARGADQFGTLLAIADLLLHDSDPAIDRQADEDRLAGWTAQLSPEAIASQSDDAPDEARCMHRILSTPADVWRGGAKYPVARYVRVAAGRDLDDEKVDLAAARDILGCIGLRVERLGVYDEKYLCIANDHQGLAKLFDGTHWADRSGTGKQWRQTLLRLPGADLLSEFTNDKGTARQTLSFGGVACRAVCVPIDTVLGEEEGG